MLKNVNAKHIKQITSALKTVEPEVEDNIKDDKDSNINKQS